MILTLNFSSDEVNCEKAGITLAERSLLHKDYPLKYKKLPSRM